ncbi:SDR family NAD(P)-dependent oxidoreductase [Natronobiforma cellulositropha]|uniref:SDR family NAD(P)-dependent oxidoreductase n=1 Tax=Natronobiforma cellulositropha TaxID=1679076 RepID=UPI0021D603A1|nr:SDR family oxidoreductase [Natronobiforma cellulositropha]
MTRGLEGAVAVVTGAGAGIGEATARRFAAEGAHVVAVDIDGEAAAETVATLTGDGAEGLPVETDVSEEAALERVARRCEEAFGRVDVLVNNAAVRGEQGPVTAADSAVIDAVIDVNLKGAIYGVKHLVPLMGEGGSVINVASIGARLPREGWSLYDATKGALVAMTKDMAYDHAADGIRVNAVSPGWAITDYHIGEREGDAADRYVEELTTPHEGGPGALERAARPEEIADAICYLASEEASYVTGTNLEVDGGGL